jgi:hypothetical protein
VAVLNTADEWFNTSVFSLPALGYIGSASRYPYRGPGQNQWGLSAFRKFSFRDRAKVDVRGEFYNAFNFTQWSAGVAKTDRKRANRSKTEAIRFGWFEIVWASLAQESVTCGVRRERSRINVCRISNQPPKEGAARSI